MTWLPIETCAKEQDEFVLLFCPGDYNEHCLRIAFWSEGTYEGDKLVEAQPGWYESEASGHNLESWGVAPTHWQPLPRPPEGRDGEEG